MTRQCPRCHWTYLAYRGAVCPRCADPGHQFDTALHDDWDEARVKELAVSIGGSTWSPYEQFGQNADKRTSVGRKIPRRDDYKEAA